MILHRGALAIGAPQRAHVGHVRKGSIRLGASVLVLRQLYPRIATDVVALPRFLRLRARVRHRTHLTSPARSHRSVCDRTTEAMWQRRRPWSLMRQQHGSRGRVFQDVAGYPANQHFPQAAVGVGAHDQ
jgi:hypothetical protein